MQLVLVRHGESIWNRENLFTGWTDVALSETGLAEAKEAGKWLREGGFAFDLCYTSLLKRAIKTLDIVLEELDSQWLPVVKDWRLNERHYGALQGLNKAETARKYGEDQVKLWRRSYDTRPPALASDSPDYLALKERYGPVIDGQVPLTESLADTVARTVPYFESVIRPEMEAGKRVIIAAHGNSLRALVKHFEGMTGEEIAGVNIPTGIPLVYTFDGDFKVTGKQYLGDSEAIAQKVEKVANQTKG